MTLSLSIWATLLSFLPIMGSLAKSGAANKTLKIIPDQSLVVAKGEDIHVRCTCNPCTAINFSQPLGYRFLWKRQQIGTKDFPRLNCHKVFACSEKRKIPCDNVCDGKEDCANGLDEKFCLSQESKHITDDVFERVYQIRFPHDTQSLVIKKARFEDSGYYSCMLRELSGDVTNRSLLIRVTNNNPKLNCDKVFQCSEARKIPCDNVCDGREHCANGLDEKNCTDMCYGKFRCKNGMCIDKKYVCDVTGINNCMDGSDEDSCPEIKEHNLNVKQDPDKTPSYSVSPISKAVSSLDLHYNVEIYPQDKQMDWLKTTVYTVIACTVGVVLLIAIIVVAIFRIKMKRNAVRRAFRQADHRRRHSHNLDGHGHQGTRAARSSVVEHEPFISAPSPTHFGNIIVNVNNGVQFVPNTELNAVLQGPPSYSEVIAMEARGRHSPPPDYSTIDRNPINLEGLPLAESNCQQLQTSSPDTVIQSVSNDTGEHGETRGGHSMQSFSANDLQVASLGAASRPEGTSSLGRRNCSQGCSRDRQIRNVRAHPLPQRPKQLQVRNGQIVLDGNSSGSSSPETVNRNTQTNPTDVNTLQQNLSKPGQLHVERGQIILSSPTDGDTITADASDLDLEGACSVQGQLEVKDGQIVFRAT